MSAEIHIDPADVMEAMERHAKIYREAHAEGYKAGFIAGVTQTRVIVEQLIERQKHL